jgi:hypothetical protein
MPNLFTLPVGNKAMIRTKYGALTCKAKIETKTCDTLSRQKTTTRLFCQKKQNEVLIATII